MHATVHARGIIDDDTTHHGTAYRCRVGREHPAIGLQDFVDTTTHNTRLQSDGFLVFTQLVFLPVLASHNEHAIRTALSTQRRASGTEGEGQVVFLADLHDFGDFLLAVAAYHHLGYLTIETGVCTPPQPTQLICVDTVGCHKSFEFTQEVSNALNISS